MPKWKQTKSFEEVEKICAHNSVWTIIPDVPLTRRKTAHCFYAPDQTIILQTTQMREIFEYIDAHDIENVCFRLRRLPETYFARIMRTTKHLKKGTQDG